MRNFTLSILLLLALFAIPALGQSETKANPKALELMSVGKFREAISLLDNEIEQGQHVLDSLIVRSLIKRMTGDFPGSLDDLNRAIAIDSSRGALFEQRADLRMILRQDMSAILADLDSAVANGVKTAKIFSTRGMIRGQFGDTNGSIADYEMAVKLQPDLALAYVGLSSAYLRMKDYGKAVAVLEGFTSALENSKSDIPTVAGRETLTTTVKMPDSSDGNEKPSERTFSVIRREVTTEPMSPEQLEEMNRRQEQSLNISLAYVNLSTLYAMQNEYAKALLTVNKGININPNSSYGISRRSDIKLDLKDYEGAVADAAKAIRMMPPRAAATAYASRGIAYLMLGKEAEAQKDFDKYLELFPKGKEFLEKRIEKAKAQAQLP